MGCTNSLEAEENATVRVDELWFNDVKHARIILDHIHKQKKNATIETHPPKIRFFHGKLELNLKTKPQCQNIGATFIWHNEIFGIDRNFANHPKNKTIQFKLTDSYIGRVEECKDEGVMDLAVHYVAPPDKPVEVGVLRVFVAFAKTVPASFKLFKKLEAWTIKGHYTSLRAALVDGKGFQLDDSNDDNEGESEYAAQMSLHGISLQSEEWSVVADPRSEPQWNRNFRWDKLDFHPRCLDIVFTCKKNKKTAMCRVDLRDVWTLNDTIGGIRYPLLPCSEFLQAANAVKSDDEKRFMKYYEARRVMLVDDDDIHTERLIKSTGYECYSPSANVDWEKETSEPPTVIFIGISKKYVIKDTTEVDPSTLPVPVPSSRGKSNSKNLTTIELDQLNETKTDLLEKCRLFRQHFKNVPIIALIDIMVDDKEFGGNLPYDDFIRKPLAEEEVKAKLHRHGANLGLVRVEVHLEHEKSDEMGEAGKNKDEAHAAAGGGKGDHEGNENDNKHEGEKTKGEDGEERGEDDPQKKSTDEDANEMKENEDGNEKENGSNEDNKNDSGEEGKNGNKESGSGEENKDGKKESEKAQKNNFNQVIQEMLETVKNKESTEDINQIDEALKQHLDQKYDVDVEKINQQTKAQIEQVQLLKVKKQKEIREKADLALRIYQQSQSVNKLPRHKTKREDKSIRMTLELTILQAIFKNPIPPRRKLVFVVSAGSHVHESLTVLDSTENGKFPLEPITFNENLRFPIRFRKEKSDDDKEKEKSSQSPANKQNETNASEKIKKTASFNNKSSTSEFPPILTISIFAYNPDHAHWAAEDLLGEWLCGQSWGDSAFTVPQSTAVQAFWQSILGQMEMKTCRIFGKDQTESGTLEFKAILHDSSNTLPKAETSFPLSLDNKKRLKEQAQLDKKMRKKGEKAVRMLTRGIELTKHSFNPDPAKSRVKLYYRPPLDKNENGPIETSGVLYWCDVYEQIEEKDRSLAIDKITEIVLGKFDSPFPVEMDTEKSFAIISTEGSLNLVADNSDQVDHCLNALQHLFKQLGLDVLE